MLWANGGEGWAAELRPPPLDPTEAAGSGAVGSGAVGSGAVGRATVGTMPSAAAGPWAARAEEEEEEGAWVRMPSRPPSRSATPSHFSAREPLSSKEPLSPLTGRSDVPDPFLDRDSLRARTSGSVRFVLPHPLQVKNMKNSKL